MKKIKNGMTYRGEMIYLTKHLIEQQCLDKKEILKVIKIHIKRIDTFEEMKELDPFKDIIKLKKLNDHCSDIDIKLQRALKFEKNPSFNIWWFRVPHCKCNVRKNFQLFGKEEKFINLNCPLHGII